MTGHPAGARVIIDYAHTPDALHAALTALRPEARGRLAVLFGAGGDRDPGKRPMMGKTAADLADLVYVTDDNPRTEDAASIRAAIIAAASNAATEAVYHTSLAFPNFTDSDRFWYASVSDRPNLGGYSV